MNHRELFRAEGLPVLQNKTFATRSEALASDQGVVCLVEDGQTGLVHNCEFDSNKLRYDANYQNEQSCSQSSQRHLGEVASIIDKHFDRQRLIEVGCGKGRLAALVTTRHFEMVVVEYELLPYFPALLERLLGWLGVPFVVDYDDALFHQYDRHQNRWVRRLLGQKIPRVMRCAHLVTAGNAYLVGDEIGV